MNEKLIDKSQSKLPEEYRGDYEKLKEILVIIKEAGLTPTNYSIDAIKQDWDESSPFPIAEEGANGIRLIRQPEEGLIITFTNGFENPKNATRVNITQKLREKGFNVV